MRAIHFLALAAVAAATSPATRAQLFIDAAGPRNLVFGAKGEAVPVADRVQLKLDSEDKSATAGFLHSRTDDKGGVNTGGFLVKAAGVNGWDDLLKYNTLPELEGTVLWNRTQARPATDGQPAWFAGPWFYNVSGAFQHSSLRLRATASSPVVDTRTDGGRALLGIGRQFGRGRNGIALSAGYARDNNYTRLPKVKVNDRDVREGVLENFDTYPVSLVLTQELAGEWIDDIVAAVPALGTGKEKGRHGAIIAAYGGVTPTSHRGTTRKLGFNFTLSKRYLPTNEEIAAAKAFAKKNLGVDDINPVHLYHVSFPLSVFVEWQTKGAKTERKTGVAVLFTWP